MNKSESINELAAALAKAQGEIHGAKKDSLNPHFKSKYADLASVWEACRAPLSKNGLAVVQTMEPRESGVTLITALMHASGQWVSSELPMSIAANATPQAVGSAITYARRYALSSMVGVAPDEDDGEAAMTRPPMAQNITPPKPSTPPPKPTYTQQPKSVESPKQMPKPLTEKYKDVDIFDENKPVQF